MEGIEWELVWKFLWPILRQGLIALLMALLTLLGYDKYVPSRFERDGGAADLRDFVVSADSKGYKAEKGLAAHVADKRLTGGKK